MKKQNTTRKTAQQKSRGSERNEAGLFFISRVETRNYHAERERESGRENLFLLFLLSCSALEPTTTGQMSQAKMTRDTGWVIMLWVC